MFLFPEKMFLESLKLDVDLAEELPKEETQFLIESKRFHQIQSRVKIKTFIFVPHNCSRSQSNHLLAKIRIKFNVQKL